MELFHNAKAVRLKSHHEKYLLAEEDEETVSQDRNGSSRSVRWTVEFVDDCQAIRLKSCYGKYLTASNSPFLLGMTGRKVLQTLPRRLDSSVEWEPVREGFQVKLKTRYGNFLRANGGLPPWRNSITHDIPHRTATQDWIVWDVDIVEIQIKSPDHQSLPPLKHARQSDSTTPQSDSTTPDSIPSSPSSESVKSAKLSSIPSSPISGSFKSHKLSKQESKDSFVSAHSKPDGRIIYFKVADDNGNADIGIEGPSIIFKGNGLDELTRVLEEETGLEDIIVCSLSPLNGKLYPLRLHLPPNNTTMNVVVLKASSKVARDFAIK